MELRHLRYFCAVAERLNFTEAARELGMAQPPLSIQIRNLERELGVTLFLRQNRAVTLTPAGRWLLADARDLLPRADRLVRRLQDESAGREGEVILTTDGSAGSEAVTKRLRKFLRKHRGLRLRVQASVEGADLAILAVEPDEVEPADVSLETANLQLALPPKHRLAERISLEPADLLGEIILLPEPDRRSAADRRGLRLMKAAGVTPGVLEIPADAGNRFWPVSLGLGVTFCSERDRGGMDAIRLPFGPTEVPLLIVARPLPGARSLALPTLLAAIKGD